MPYYPLRTGAVAMFAVRCCTIPAIGSKGGAMIAVGETAPGFSLKDQFGRTLTLEQFKGKRHVMLLFYPLDFTPT
jgi:cytochrome oxidase Cu insertion factor (SCO1/SenC/PrrC family)